MNAVRPATRQRNRSTHTNGASRRASPTLLGPGVFDLTAFRAKIEARDVMSVTELAEYLALGINTTYVYLRDGTIPGTRVGRRWIISRRRIDAWLDAQTEQPIQPGRR